MGTVSILFNIIIIFILALIIVIPFVKTSLLFQPTRKIDKFPSDYGIPFMEVTILTKDDIKLSAWYIPSKMSLAGGRNADLNVNVNVNQLEITNNKNANDIILFCHGNGGNISSRKTLISLLYKLGYGLFIFDYRGYGRSTGSASIDGFYKDIETVWDYLTKIRGINEKNIILFGESIGVSVASYIAQKHNPKCLILQSGFASLDHIVEDYLPASTPRVVLNFINKIIIGNDFNTINYIKNVVAPKLILHSLSDDIVPFYHSQLLYDNCLEPKEFYEIKGTHNDFQIDKLYVEEIDNFVKSSNIIQQSISVNSENIPEIEYFNEEKTNKKVQLIIDEIKDTYSPSAHEYNDDTTDDAADETTITGNFTIVDSDDVASENESELSSDDEEMLRDIINELDEHSSESDADSGS